MPQCCWILDSMGHIFLSKYEINYWLNKLIYHEFFDGYEITPFFFQFLNIASSQKIIKTVKHIFSRNFSYFFPKHFLDTIRSELYFWLYVIDCNLDIPKYSKLLSPLALLLLFGSSSFVISTRQTRWKLHKDHICELHQVFWQKH